MSPAVSRDHTVLTATDKTKHILL